MEQFTSLYLELDQTTRTSDKLEALVRYFRAADPQDAAWAAYVLSGRKLTRAVSAARLREWAAAAGGYPLWLVEESYEVVGDLSETLSLVVPPAVAVAPPPLHEMIEQVLRPIASRPLAAQREMIAQVWDRLSNEQRFVFHKLISGNFRVGVSRQLLIRALAEVAGVEPAVTAHRLAGTFTPDAASYRRLICGPGEAGDCADPSLPYPFMLANPLEAGPESLGAVDAWAIEWKWDGIRAQLIRRVGKTALWSRGDEMVGGAFPEIVQAGSALADGTVVDGEIVAWDAGRPLPFTQLQQRLNRKHVELSFWPAVPVVFIAFDLLETEGKDIRTTPLAERQAMLERLVRHEGVLRLAERPACPSWDAASDLLCEARQRGVEGVIIKRRDSTYQPGRPRGDWWKLKVQPFSIDAVLIAAEPGRGRRAGLMTDYTFGVWDETGALVPVAKAYSGLTDAEIASVDRFVRNHTKDRYGPVRMVEPSLVFELGFEAIARSTRHKSGVALRFPRMLRWRTDKKPADADTLASVRALLSKCEERA